MKLTSMIYRSTGSASLAAALFVLFASTGKADCGLSAMPRAIASLGDSKPIATDRSQAEALRVTEDKSGQGSIVGLWLTTFNSGGQVVDQGFDVWTSDGTEILNDTPPPATGGNVCLGTWVRTAPNTFLLKHPSWTFDAAGNLTGTAIIRETVVVQPDNSTFKGTFTVDVLTLGGVVVQHLAGTVTATRITVD